MAVNRPLPLAGIYSPRGSFSRYAASGSLAVAHNFLNRNGVWQLSPGINKIWTSAITKTYAFIFFTGLNSVGWALRVGQSGADVVYEQHSFAGTPVTSTATVNATATFPTDQVSSMVEFRNKVVFSTGMSGVGYTANGLWQHNTGSDGSTPYVRKCGLAAPGSTMTSAAGAAGALTGTYQYKVTFVHSDGHDTNPNTTATSVSVTAQRVSLSNIPLGGSTVTARKIWRTIANGALFLQCATIPDNTTTTYSDNAADSTLGKEVETDNDLPPESISAICSHNNRLWVLDASTGDTIRACKADSVTTDPNIDGFPILWAFKVGAGGGGDAGKTMFSLGGYLYFCTNQRIYRVSGDPRSGLRSEIALNEGIISLMGYCYVPGGVVFLSNTSKLYFWDGDKPPENIGANFQGILNLFTPTVAPRLYYDTVNNEVRIVPNASFSSSIYERGHFVVNLSNKAVGHSTNNGLFCGFSTTGDLKAATDLCVYEEASYVRTAAPTEADYVPTSAQLLLHPVVLPDGPQNVQRVGAVLKSLPIWSSIPPAVTMQVTLQNGKVISKMCDISSLQMSSVGGTPLIVVYAPVFETVSEFSLSLKPVATTTNKSAILNGLEVHQVFYESTPLPQRQVAGASVDR